MLPGSHLNNREICRGIYQYALPDKPWIFIFHRQSVDTLRHLATNKRMTALIGRLGDPRLAEAAGRLSVPVINIHGGNPMAGLVQIGTDSREVGAFAAQKLIDSGVRSFGYFGLPGADFSTTAEEGFCQVLDAAGLNACIMKDTPATHSSREWTQRLHDWLDELPPETAVYCPDDVFAHNLACAAIQGQRKIPDDLMILGTNNDTVYCLGVQPPLSSIRLPWKQIGARAAAILDDWLAGTPPPSSPIRVGGPELVSRQSTRVQHCRDELVDRALEIMRENVRAPIKMDLLAQQVGASRRNLEIHFKRTLDRSPLQEMNRLRLEEVKRLLRHDPGTIEQISDQCKFSSPVYLSQFFQRETGMSPGAYRKAFGELSSNR
jgi:LacI family transcriptional regulator